MYDYVDNWVGWENIAEMLTYAKHPVAKKFFIFSIKTGGRAKEVLRLQAENFEVRGREKCILVKDMELEKRFNKIGLLPPSDIPHAKKWLTEKKAAARKTFPIKLNEPFSTELIQYLQETPKGYLFKSPYQCNDPPVYSRFWAYKQIIKVNDALPPDLFNRLGLNREFKDRKGNVIASTIHLWLHLLRSWRASQLAAEYDFSEAMLMEFFGWVTPKEAHHYSHLGYSKLLEQMRKNE